MKQVWNETTDVGAYEWCNVWDGPTKSVTRSDHVVFANTIAQWDKKSGVLCVDQSYGAERIDPSPLNLPPRRILKTIRVREEMLREVLRITEEWNWEVKFAIPHPLSDGEVLACYREQQAQPVDA